MAACVLSDDAQSDMNHSDVKNAYKTAYFAFEIVQEVSNTCLWELWKITATRGGSWLSVCQ